jgi:hypothetical protein
MKTGVSVDPTLKKSSENTSTLNKTLSFQNKFPKPLQFPDATMLLLHQSFMLIEAISSENFLLDKFPPPHIATFLLDYITWLCNMQQYSNNAFC